MTVAEGEAVYIFFFFNDTATTEIYTLSLHDALPIFELREELEAPLADEPRKLLVVVHEEGEGRGRPELLPLEEHGCARRERSEEHTSELQSRQYLVCRLLLEKKKQNLISTYV